MSYTPTTWTTGDTITATAMNKIENGIASAGNALIVTMNLDGELDTTYKDIWDALEDGIPVYLSFVYGDYTTSYVSTCWNCPITVAYKYSNTYTVMASRPSIYNGTHLPSILLFETTNIDGYPEFLNKRYVTYSSTSTDQDFIY